MSKNTKIIVLKSKELVYTGIFITLGLLLVLLLVYMFSPDRGSKKEKASITETTAETTDVFSPGVYSSTLNLGGSKLLVTVTVNGSSISHIDLQEMDETVTAMYPLLAPSLDDINKQLDANVALDDITFSGDRQYTTIMILDAARQALSR